MRAAALLLLLAVGGCREQRSFNEQFDDTEQELQDRARNLDEQLANNSAEAENTAD